MNARRRAARTRDRMRRLLLVVRKQIERSDAVCKQQWAARGVTDYKQAIKDWRVKKVKVPVDHPFNRFLKGDSVLAHPFYRGMRAIMYDATPDELEQLFKIFGVK